MSYDEQTITFNKRLYGEIHKKITACKFDWFVEYQNELASKSNGLDIPLELKYVVDNELNNILLQRNYIEIQRILNKPWFETQTQLMREKLDTLKLECRLSNCMLSTCKKEISVNVVINDSNGTGYLNNYQITLQYTKTFDVQAYYRQYPRYGRTDVIIHR
jgi:hypothetical protein